jgi:hypothetical protein
MLQVSAILPVATWGDISLIDDNALLWVNLRQRRFGLRERSELLKSSAARRATLGAAMEQFEEQMTAAKVVTAATRPLNLYYGLVQAGMAIAAVHIPGQWSFASHGLELGDTQVSFSDLSVAPKGDGAFQRVAAAIGSEIIDGAVTIDRLWSSLPDLCQVAQLPESESPLASAIHRV